MFAGFVIIVSARGGLLPASRIFFLAVEDFCRPRESCFWPSRTFAGLANLVSGRRGHLPASRILFLAVEDICRPRESCFWPSREFAGLAKWVAGSTRRKPDPNSAHPCGTRVERGW